MEKKIEDERETFEKKGVQAKTNIIIGPRWRVINTFAKEKDIDLIVMGSHGLKTETGQMAIGTTSHKVAFSSPCPVLLIRYGERGKKKKEIFDRKELETDVGCS